MSHHIRPYQESQIVVEVANSAQNLHAKYFKQLTLTLNYVSKYTTV